MKLHKKNIGFTIIELLVVIGIIGLIFSFILVGIKSSRERAELSNVLRFSAQIHHALGAYAMGIWDFNEGSGTAVKDSSSNENNATLGDGTCNPGAGKCPDWTTDTPSKEYSALSFDGDDYLLVSGDVGLDGAVTISVWIKKDAKTGTGYDYIVDARIEGDATPWYLLVADTTGKIIADNGVEAQNSDWEADEWVHIAVTDDTSISKMYINGELVDTGSGISSKIGTNLYIGTRWTLASYFEGLIDDFRIYNEPFSAAQIQKLYAEGVRKRKLAVE